MSNGLAALLGFDCPANFNLPYISGSITEFWRRWHITLSGWFRDYIYIPLGGNRVSMNVTLVGKGEELFLTAITSGGSQAVFWKINTMGEEAFLQTLIDAMECKGSCVN